MAAKRIFVSISTKSRYWSQACESTEAVIEIALALAKQTNLVDPDTRDVKWIVEEKWGSRTHIVFDVLHDTYDSKTAHLPGHNNLPVISVFLSREESVQTANQLLRDRVNEEVRETHRVHPAGIEPPFIVDHTNVVIFATHFKDGECLPYEFHYATDEDADAELGLPTDSKYKTFIQSFNQILREKEALGLFGLCRYPGDDFEGRVEITEGGANINLHPDDAPQHLAARPAAWYFSPVLFGKRTCICGGSGHTRADHQGHVNTR